MVEATEEVKIDTNLYSRQIGTFGLETMGKLVKMNVLIVGQRGLGVETAKNLILAGPARVDLYDPNTVEIKDLTSNFYLREGDVGQRSRAAASVGQLQELNPYVRVNVVDSLSVEDHKNYSVVVYTEVFDNLEKIQEVNQFCRDNRVGFILSETLGLAGYAFLDYGESFSVTDADGEQTKSFIVVNITQEENGVVTTHEDKRHSYQDGDYVKFVEVEGMTELNNREPIQIYGCTKDSFKLKLDTREFGAYRRQGVVENVKVPKPVKFDSLTASVADPVASSAEGMLMTPDLAKWGRSDQLHLGIRAIHAFKSKNGRYPEDTAADL